MSSPPQKPLMPIMALDASSRWAVFALIFALLLLGWGYMVYMAWAMQNMATVEMWMPPIADTRPWQGYDFLMLSIMWVLMMAAMMLPSTLPMVLVFTQIVKRRTPQAFMLSVFVFICGYLFAWSIYSLLAVVLQWQLHVRDLLTPMMDSRSYLWSGLVLLCAGVYQFTPLKESCLRQCQSPLGFLLTQWREHYRGALIMGAKHGFYCVGCCWALMTILFAVGVMNMFWIVALSLLAVLEKSFLSPQWGSKVVGVLITSWACWWLWLAWHEASFG